MYIIFVIIFVYKTYLKIISDGNFEITLHYISNVTIHFQLRECLNRTHLFPPPLEVQRR